jgi:hypothetical protein
VSILRGCFPTAACLKSSVMKTPNSLDGAVDEYTLPFDYGHAVEA